MVAWFYWKGYQKRSLSSAEAPVSKHQWKKKEESGSAGERKWEPFPAFPARFKFSLFPASARFYPARLWEASTEEREKR